MRLWSVPAALLLLVAGGCASPVALTGSVVEPMAAPSPAPPAVPPPATPSPFDPEELASKLTGIQPQWPKNSFPAAPAVRKLDCRRIRCVALTFDDGPGPHTARLLDILARHQARATFFVIGQMVAEDRGENLRRMVSEGHELGNHSWDHPPLTQLSEARLKYQLRSTQKIVKRLSGVRMTLMRPPYGSTDGRVAAETRREGLAQILWNVDTLDWRDRESSIVTQRATQAGPGSIVLMHDIHGTTVDAVPAILDQFARRGYAFVTLSELYGRARLTPGRRYTSYADR
ncbi:polysaccharide deacetylase family protein [Streptosporangium sp. NPDC006007]|uniref:polysaccharide deacetylase family protein n=1 Tax=Streptosporangium sp. NPDC006007 TaxID=3154575 RepID=UPI0033ABF352